MSMTCLKAFTEQDKGAADHNEGNLFQADQRISSGSSKIQVFKLGFKPYRKIEERYDRTALRTYPYKNRPSYRYEGRYDRNG